MIANFFSITKPITLLRIFILLFVYILADLFSQDLAMFTWTSFSQKTGFFFLCIFMLLVVNFIIRKNSLTQNNSYALLLFVFLLGIFSETISSSTLAISNLILLFGLRKMYSLRTGLNTKMKLFDAGFWIAIATLVYFWSIAYFLLIYIAIIVYNKVSLKNLTIPIVGFFTPLLLYFTYAFYTDNLALFFNCFNYTIGLDFYLYNNLKLLIPITFVFTILVWAVLTVTPKIVLISNPLKLAWNVLVHHLVISLFVVAISPVKNGSEMFFLVFPSAIIITIFLQKKKDSSVFKNLILYMFFAISVVVYFL